ncbi:protein CASC1 isoform X2 [Cephus cinctus]|uniref:Protein CASC1 isoform X2 n=1 Tax=Cephus cinctus TaxID=211228 RepID=A0AAJ7VXG0_CEPCN|nr:protein CASC1 isoform X2 [Cephus cinctus]
MYILLIIIYPNLCPTFYHILWALEIRLLGLKPKKFREWTESQPIPGKIKNRSKTKKALMSVERDKAAAAAIEAEKNKNRLIKEMHEEIRLEKINSEKQALLEEQQAAMRKMQLENTWYTVYDNDRAFMDYSIANNEHDEWLQFMSCDGLPDPGVLSDMNTYMFLWSLEDEDVDMDLLAEKYEVVNDLLMKLDNVINFSTMKEPSYLNECKLIRQEFRNKLQFWLDNATYRLLRQIERDMVREDLKNSRYFKEAKEMICCVWALIRLPISIKQVSDRDKKPVEVTFNEIDLTIKMPMDMDCYCMAIRGMWAKYDYFSDQSASFEMPELPDEYQMNMDLLTYCENEYETKLRIREEQVEGRQMRLEEKKMLLERMTNPPPVLPNKLEKKAKQSKKTSVQYGRVKKPEPEPEPEPLPYLPTPDEVILLKEEEMRKEVRRLLFTRCEKTEVNLRKYSILGGVFYIDLVYQPPQPKDMRREIFLTTLQIPKELKYVPFSKPYKAPPPAKDSERSPEVIEEEMKALEAAMEALALVTLKLPESVLWFEPPLVAHWISEKKIWSTQDVHDIKYNEEKQIINFRTGRLGVHGLAGFRFINLPFQSWELKPEMGKGNGGGVILSITAAIVQAEFIVREDLVCLHSLIGGTTTALQNIKMREGGCDLFPERDAYSYVKGLPVKHPVAEKHLQTCMGLLCTAFNFSWSRWNATCSPRQIVMQFKELHGCIAKQRSNMMLLVTPLQAMVVNCTEVSQEFSDQPMEGDKAKFYADIYHMALHNVGIKSRILIQSVSFKLATTVSKLLQCTNVISMSS